MSDSDVDTLSFDAWVTDPETVVDTVSVDRLRSSEYARRHRGRSPMRYSTPNVCRSSSVRRVHDWRKEALSGRKERRDAMATSIRLGWGATIHPFGKCSQGFSSRGQRIEQADISTTATENVFSPVRRSLFDVVGEFDIMIFCRE